MTESGKTTLAKKLAAQYKQNGINILVLDPLNDPQWAADYQTDEPGDFLDMFYGSRQCAVFIDEAGDAVGRYDTVMQRTATRGRHWGHSVHYISQRGAMLSTTVRDQCSRLFLFASSKKDSKLWSEEFNSDELLDAHTLRAGEFYQTGRFAQTTKMRIF